ncbi:MAG TPA: hypothetical protein VKL19_16815, partial [Thermoanaerobaculia bacterium]|nr:hypothetical protein [Thermoanaerobaculia bacterium]
MEPLRNVLRRWIDAIEWRNVIDAAIVELLCQGLQLLLRTDEVDSDGVGIDSAALRCELRFDLVRMPMKRLRDPAIFTQKMSGLESRLTRTKNWASRFLPNTR